MSSKLLDLTVEEVKAQLANQYLGGLKEAWTLEELQGLEGLLAERGWRYFVRYLSPLRQMVEREVLKGRLAEGQYKFMCGQWDVLERIRRLPEEIEQMRVKLVEEKERESGA